MNKQDYLILRNSNQISIDLAFEFYINQQSPHPKLPHHIFVQLFQIWLGSGTANLTKYFQFYDEQHKVITLIKKDGSILYM